MMKRIVQAAMVVSWGYYALAVVLTWGLEVLGDRTAVLSLFDFEPGNLPVPAWLLLFGLAVALAVLANLGIAYRAIWQILEAGSLQEFDALGRRLKWLGGGLVGFWISWNLLTGIFQRLLANYANIATAMSFEWNPFDVDIVLPIVGSAIFLTATMMQRAWQAEEENRQFL